MIDSIYSWFQQFYNIENIALIISLSINFCLVSIYVEDIRPELKKKKTKKIINRNQL